jgi:hypothetical protein
VIAYSIDRDQIFLLIDLAGRGFPGRPLFNAQTINFSKPELRTTTEITKEMQMASINPNHRGKSKHTHIQTPTHLPYF